MKYEQNCREDTKERKQWGHSIIKAEHIVLRKKRHWCQRLIEWSC